MLQTQKTNIAPRIGFAYQVTPKLVVRGGVGLFYNSFENQGYGPNIGENYPFVFNITPSTQAPPGFKGPSGGVVPTSYNTSYAHCPSAAGDPTSGNGTANFESGFSCVSLNTQTFNAQSLGLQGLQFNYATPRTYSANLSVQYSLTRSISAQAAYVYTQGADLQGGVGYQNVTQILPNNVSGTKSGSCNTKNSDGTLRHDYGVFPGDSCVPFPDFGGGSYQATYGDSTYHSLQTKIEDQLSNGLTFLVTYTWSKAMSDAGDLLNGGTTGGLRAYNVPGLGPRFDWAPADFDLRNVVHISGGYQLPFGKDMRWMNIGRPRERDTGRLGRQLDCPVTRRPAAQLRMPHRNNPGNRLQRCPGQRAKSATWNQDQGDRRRTEAVLDQQRRRVQPALQAVGRNGCDCAGSILDRRLHSAR